MLWSLNESDINEIENHLIDAGVNLGEKVSAAGFLCITVERDGEIGMIELKQTGLTDLIIESS